MRANNSFDFDYETQSRHVPSLRKRGGFDVLLMLGLVLATLLIPLVGLITGFLDLTSKSQRRRSQGLAFLALGLVMCVLYAAFLSRG